MIHRSTATQRPVLQRVLAVFGCVGLFLVPLLSQETPGNLTLHVEADTVLVNVVVRDAHTGALVTGLTASDFSVLEDGKPQRIASFDYESVDMAQPLNQATISGLAGAMRNSAGSVAPPPDALRNHRLIVFFFDLTSMQPEDVDRAVDAAKDFLNHKMQPADLVSLVSLDTSLTVDQDFTSDRDLLLAKVGSYNDTTGSGFAQGANADTNQVEDASGYTPDETEYNDINTDRELFAIRSIARSLERINQRKSLLYFSGGLERDGIENQASLRAVINSAVRANMAVYSVDTRGLEAISPLGDASTGSLRGTGSFNGGALQNNFNSNFDTQETLTTLAADTGGKAFLDSNDFAPAFAQVQRDTSAYYVLGFHSTNPRRDGRFRRLTVRVNRPGVKLDYRRGYYAPADFAHASKDDRERQLEEQLASDLPATDVALYLDAYFFHLDAHRYFVPVSLIVPGAQIPFVKGGDREKATLDVIGEVLDQAKHPVGQVRETVKLALDAADQPTRKNIQYTTSFTLPPGDYTLRFVVRENQSGRMGSFETPIHLPPVAEKDKTQLKLSSVVIAAHRAPVAAQKSRRAATAGQAGQAGQAEQAEQAEQADPLVHDGERYIPNITHVFTTAQHLYVLCEVFDPAREKPTESSQKTDKHAVRLIASMELIQGGAKVYETPPVVATALNTPQLDAAAILLDLPLDSLKPGEYIAQLNVIDDAAGSFAFPRFAVLVRGPQPDAASGTAPK